MPKVELEVNTQELANVLTFHMKGALACVQICISYTVKVLIMYKIVGGKQQVHMWRLVN